jgi:NAD(P) transhydrogenase subunit alpha
VKEQVESVGAKFITFDVDAGASEDKGGYAKAMDEAFYKKQRELMTAVVHDQDVVITTAAVPGRKAPILLTGEMVEAMAPGSVVVDIAAERGVNLPSDIPYHASQMFAANITAFLKHIVRNGALTLTLDDEIIRETLVTHGNKVVHPRVAELLDLSTAALP